METRKALLAAARKNRTCPPPSAGHTTENKMLYQQHLSLCPYCASSKPEEISGWAQIAEKILASYRGKAAAAEGGQVRSGQLRFIRQDLATWRNGMYYSPPLVLVLELTKAVSDDVLVAQTYWDIGLAAPGDLLLTRTQTGLADIDLLVETWNIYTVKASYLEDFIGKNVGKKVVKAVLAMDQNPDYHPAWAEMPRPISDAHDPRIYFRKLEIEVGAVFSVSAVRALMDEHSGVPDESVSVQDLMVSIRRLVPDAYWRDMPDSVDETLALARYMRLSAAETDESEIIAKLAVFRDGMLQHFATLTAHILQKQLAGGKLSVSGRIQKPPAPFHNARLIAFLDIPGRKPLASSNEAFDGETGSFYVEFENGQQIKGHLELAVLISLAPDREDME